MAKLLELLAICGNLNISGKCVFHIQINFIKPIFLLFITIIEISNELWRPGQKITEFMMDENRRPQIFFCFLIISFGTFPLAGLIFV